ncbi:MAG: hypothetical protein JNM88_05415 [Chitinophagaceae bacterium]|nr:hypothetical protein [Chitinophagaceae bacterium]
MRESKAGGQKKAVGRGQDFNNLSIKKRAFPGSGEYVHIRPFPLKIKFLDKLYNAYFSAQFQTKIPYYEKKLLLFSSLVHGLPVFNHG